MHITPGEQAQMLREISHPKVLPLLISRMLMPRCFVCGEISHTTTTDDQGFGYWSCGGHGNLVDAITEAVDRKAVQV